MAENTKKARRIASIRSADKEVSSNAPLVS